MNAYRFYKPVVRDLVCFIRIICTQVKKSGLQKSIASLLATGSTCLSAAIETATDMFTDNVIEEKDTTNRIIFLTDLCSTVDSVNDEKKLLNTIKANAQRGIFTSVVGVGMVCCVSSDAPMLIDTSISLDW